MGQLVLKYSESRTGGDIINPDEQWSCRTDGHIQWHPELLYRDSEKCPDWIRETIDVGDKKFESNHAIMVTVRYRNGDTFGTTYGNWYIVGLYETIEEAHEVEKQINEGNFTCDCGYNPWNGYFARFEYVQTDILHIV